LAYAKDAKTAAFYESLGPEHKVNRSRPLVEEDARGLYEAFHLLHPSRPQHFGGAGAIPFTEIDAFCRLFAITEARETVARQLRRLDVAYLGLVEKNRTPRTPVTNGRNHARHPHQPARRP
jgi:hypothetical protein